MSEIITLNPSVQLVNGKATTTSKQIAEVFVKEHRNVLRDIETLCAELPQDALLNFEQGYYTLPATGDQQHRQYTMTRDGFTLLAMGFTGKKALQFKLAYIAAFNAMEAALSQAGDVPALPEYITAAQAGEISALINEHFPDGKDRPYAWGKFNTHFKTASTNPNKAGYKMLPASRFAEACAYIPTIPKRDGTVENAFASLFMPPDGRYVVRIRNGRAECPMLVPEDACVMTVEKLLHELNAPNGIYVSTATLTEFTTAALKRLAQQCEYHEAKRREANQGVTKCS